MDKKADIQIAEDVVPTTEDNGVKPNAEVTAVDLITKDFLLGITKLSERNKTTLIPTRIKENRVISMSLYGRNPRYTNGAVENTKLLKKVFPGWKLRVHVPKRGILSNMLGIDLAVPKEIIDELKSLNAHLIFMDPFKTVDKPMMWRFLVANDVTVDRFIVRDTDSRLIPRDATEVKVWIQSGMPFHCIRDHPGHSKWPISRGLWGAVPSKLQLILRNTTFGDKMKDYSFSFYQDMKFLRDVVWPQVKYFAYCSDSLSCKKWESSHPFSANRSENLEFVGEVISGNGIRRIKDVELLRKNPFSKDCLQR